MVRHTITRSFRILPAALLVLPGLLCARETVSLVRAVQLSYVRGTVAIRRPGSAKWSDAPRGTPIQQGFELRTSAGSYAEVEFENGSMALLGQLSEMRFGELALDSEGHKLNRLDFQQGDATFSFKPEHRDLYEVRSESATLVPNGNCQFRADFDHGRLRVEVFKGSLNASVLSGSYNVGRDAVTEFELGSTASERRQGI
jgi:hypothetical protein